MSWVGTLCANAHYRASLLFQKSNVTMTVKPEVEQSSAKFTPDSMTKERYDVCAPCIYIDVTYISSSREPQNISILNYSTT